ncbi:MAG: HlyD family type I secretion periplasmic adaptor subunit [Rhodobiaceae bacterium]|nr:HlyD family type I secretion periplasmic adaptor subunit [Rhodobiaceae bacterium]
MSIAENGSASTLSSKFAALLKPEESDVSLGEGPDGDQVLGAVRGPLLVGVFVILFFFGVLGIWAATAPLTGGTVAFGVVSPDGNRRVVQHFEGGIIDSFAVKNGDKVAVGDTLVVLQDTQVRANFDLVRGQYFTLQAMLARLLAEQSNAGQITWPFEQNDVDADTRLVMETQTKLMEVRRENRLGQTQILEQRVAQLSEEISGLRALIESETKQLALVNEEAGSVAEMVSRGLERKPRLLALQRAATEIEGSRASNAAAIARAEQAIGETEIQILNLEAQHQDDVVEQITRVRSEISKLEEQLFAAKDILDRIVLRAPVAGIVVNRRFSTVGGVVSPGEPILDIVPEGEDLVIDVRIPPIDIDSVREGLDAKIYLSAFNARNLPQISGVVKSVSADALEDQNTGERYYAARVEVDRQQLASIAEETSQDLTLHPGMPAELLIVTGERTMLSYLMQPFTESMRRAFR